jgi:hypothetical protein
MSEFKKDKTQYKKNKDMKNNVTKEEIWKTKHVRNDGQPYQ